MTKKGEQQSEAPKKNTKGRAVGGGGDGDGDGDESSKSEWSTILNPQRNS
jgi:hypothetical protein